MAHRSVMKVPMHTSDAADEQKEQQEAHGLTFVDRCELARNSRRPRLRAADAAAAT